MFDKFLNIFRIEDLRKRVIFTLALLAVYRFGAHIPTPGIDGKQLAQFFNNNSGSALGLVDLFSGGNLRRPDGICPGHHAVHYGVHYLSTADP